MHHKDDAPVLNHSVPVRHPGRWISAIIIIGVVAIFASTFFTNPKYSWDTVGKYILDTRVVQGIGATLLLTVASMALAIVLAILLAVMRQSDNPVLRWSSWFWVWFFRGTPVYTQLIFWGLVTVLFPLISVGFNGNEIIHIIVTDPTKGLVPAILGLGLNESAYLAEIFRAGLKSVDKGQMEAAQALGMSNGKIMWRIVLPQAMRIIVPPTGNETIGMLKTTSLVLAVPYTYDLTFVTNALANRLYNPIPFLIIAAFWYLLITSILMVGQYYLEKHYGRGIEGGAPQVINPDAMKAQMAGQAAPHLSGGGA